MLSEPKCSKRNCVHFLGVLQKRDSASEEGERPYCKAYPNGIPEDIAYGDDPHTEVRDDQDNDITFETV